MGLDWRLGWGRVIGVLRFSMVIFLEFPVHSVVVERRGIPRSHRPVVYLASILPWYRVAH